MKRKLASLIVLTMLFVSMNGCGTFKAYEGPELPDSELATIHGHWRGRFFILFSTFDEFTIECVDGMFHGYASEAKVLPGSHWIRFHHESTIVVPFAHGTGYFTCGMDIETKAGHEYHIVPRSLEFEQRPPRSFGGDVRRGSVEIEDRISGSPLGKMRIPTDCAAGLATVICRTDADCGGRKSTCVKKIGLKIGLCELTPSNP